MSKKSKEYPQNQEFNVSPRYNKTKKNSWWIKYRQGGNQMKNSTQTI